MSIYSSKHHTKHKQPYAARKLTGGLVVLMIAIGNAPAKADTNLNCDAYAAAATKQAKENVQRGCKFKGSLWSLDYNGHKNWCLSPGVKMANLTWGDKERARLLQQCKDKSQAKFDRFRVKQKFCLKYAHKAKTLRAGINKHCETKEWPASLKQDVDFCMKSGGAHAASTNTKRQLKINACKKEAAVKTFYHSGVKRNRKWLPVDVCTHGVRESEVGLTNACGKYVADKFCKSKGYKVAIKFPKKNYDGGSNMDGKQPATWWIGSQKPCTGKCTGFSSITCKGKRW